MSYFMVDVEHDGDAAGLYSMVCFAAVKVVDGLKIHFYGQVCPIFDQFIPEMLAVSGFTREEHLRFPRPEVVMPRFSEWVKSQTKGKPVFMSDNPASDFGWINYYFRRFCGKNPFGYSGRRIGDLYCGMQKDAYASYKHLVKTPHTHHPLDDATGDAEALLAMKEMGLKIDLR